MLCVSEPGILTSNPLMILFSAAAEQGTGSSSPVVGLIF